MSQLEPLMQQNFIEYASYVIVDRAIPDVRDGCKPVQRRILSTLFDMDDGKFHKVANVIGESMKLHPHGDVSIGDALVVLSNKEYFIEKQGNFGNIITGHAAAASRYIECRLTDLARETLFNKALTKWQPSYDGRKQEPKALPAKLPVVLMLGTEGIAVGMATKILPHNFVELLEAQIKILNGGKATVYPDFQHGGIVDVSEYDDGRGRVKVRAKIDAVGDKKVVIREIPFGTTTESLIASIEAAAQKNQVKISSISDFTTDKVEIELHLSRGIYVDEVIPQLFAYTDCEISVSSNIVVIDGRQPKEMTISEVLELLSEQLKNQIQAELVHELSQLEDRQHWLTLEQIFIENRVYKRIEKAETEEAVGKAVYDGMKPFSDLFIRSMTDEDVNRLLELRIRRISAFDINKHKKEIDDIVKAMKANRAKQKALVKTTVAYLEGLLKKYGPRYPRRTVIESFQTVDKRSVARQNIKVSYDRETGYWGTDVRGKEYAMAMTEFELVLAVCRDGTYRVLTPAAKVLMASEVLYCDKFDPDRGIDFTVVYLDETKVPFAKKVHIQSFIRNKEYELIKDKSGHIVELIRGNASGKVMMQYYKKANQRDSKAKFDLAELTVTGTSAKGARIGERPVQKLELVGVKIVEDSTGAPGGAGAGGGDGGDNSDGTKH